EAVKAVVGISRAGSESVGQRPLIKKEGVLQLALSIVPDQPPKPRQQLCVGGHFVQAIEIWLKLSLLCARAAALIQLPQFRHKETRRAPVEIVFAESNREAIAGSQPRSLEHLPVVEIF